MPRFTPDALRKIGYELFETAGCPPDDAKAVADHLVESHLFGHDSHGTIRYFEYAKAIREGRFKPGQQPEILREGPSFAVVDAHQTLGQVGATFATRLAIQKAKESGIATVTLRNTSHIGRVGAYPLMAAREGLIGQIFVNAGHLGYQIAPFGGIDGKLSTDPLAFSAPRRDGEPLMVDMTTSVVAEGKIRIAMNRGEHVPEGWIIDPEGKPTTDPMDFKGNPPGAMLPLGGARSGHKGFGMAMMVEFLGGALGGQGCASGEKTMMSNGILLNVYNIDHFIERDTYFEEVEQLIRHVKSSRPAEGFTEVLLPGEPEFRMAERKNRDGIEVDETTWETVCDEGRQLGLDPEGWETGY